MHFEDEINSFVNTYRRFHSVLQDDEVPDVVTGADDVAEILFWIGDVLVSGQCGQMFWAEKRLISVRIAKEVLKMLTTYNCIKWPDFSLE